MVGRWGWEREIWTHDQSESSLRRSDWTFVCGRLYVCDDHWSEACSQESGEWETWGEREEDTKGEREHEGRGEGGRVREGRGREGQGGRERGRERDVTHTLT